MSGRRSQMQNKRSHAASGMASLLVTSKSGIRADWHEQKTAQTEKPRERQNDANGNTGNRKHRKPETPETRRERKNRADRKRRKRKTARTAKRRKRKHGANGNPETPETPETRRKKKPARRCEHRAAYLCPWSRLARPRRAAWTAISGRSEPALSVGSATSTSGSTPLPSIRRSFGEK